MINLTNMYHHPWQSNCCKDLQMPSSHRTSMRPSVRLGGQTLTSCLYCLLTFSIFLTFALNKWINYTTRKEQDIILRLPSCWATKQLSIMNDRSLGSLTQPAKRTCAKKVMFQTQYVPNNLVSCISANGTSEQNIKKPQTEWIFKEDFTINRFIFCDCHLKLKRQKAANVQK